MFELRSSFLNGSLLLDTLANTAFGVVNAIVEDLVATKQLDAAHKDQVKVAATLRGPGAL